MVQMEGLVKQYDDTLAVDQLTFNVYGGEILGLVGPNGAGKTTTMRCLCGIIPPTAGFIQVCGVPLHENPVAVKQQVAFVPADPKFFDYLTVREHLRLFARLYDCGDREAEMERLLHLLKIEDKQHHLPSALSRGMQQKLVIACALIHNPNVLIFDEPFTGLDPLAIRIIKKLLKELAQENKAIIVSSHLLGMVEEMVDRVLILQKGKKIAHGTLHELVTKSSALRERGLEDIFLELTGGLGSQELDATPASPEPSPAPVESESPTPSVETEANVLVESSDASVSVGPLKELEADETTTSERPTRSLKPLSPPSDPSES
ncbi:MAG: ABC transporter ATP-binding protein [Deltaproteobacteria bacterium]|nr:MAG: ABC transporter ATP-binding protein [Deltaproteobacteria bacterium]